MYLVQFLKITHLDVVVFDENTIEDKATFESPHAYSEGFKMVMVNGKIVLQDGKTTNERPGVILYGKAKID